MKREDYVMNHSIYALIPLFEGDEKCKLITENGKCYVDDCAHEILRRSCLENGSSFDGRIESVKYLLSISHRIPIPISPKDQLIAIPIHSHKRKDNTWIMLHAVHSYLPVENHSTCVQLINGEELVLPVTFSSFERQMNRAIVIGFKFREF